MQTMSLLSGMSVLRADSQNSDLALCSAQLIIAADGASFTLPGNSVGSPGKLLASSTASAICFSFVNYV